MNSTQHGYNLSTEVPTYIEIFHEPDGLRIFRLVLISLVIFSSLVGNFIVCKTVWKIPYQKPFSYYLVANVAVAELINALCVPFIVVYEEKGSWILGKTTCILVNPLLVMSMCVITNSLAIIAVYRYRATLNKTRPAGFVKAIVILGVWLMALAMTMPLFVTRKLVHKHSTERLTCSSYFPGDTNTANTSYNRYTIVRLIFTFAVPYFIILTAYIALAIKLKIFVRKTFKDDYQIDMSSFISSQAQGGAEHGPEAGNANTSPPVLHGKRNTKKGQTTALERNTRKRRKRRQRRNLTIETAENNLLKTIFVIIVIFVACYTPYQAMFLWEYFGEVMSWQFYYHKLMRDYLFILKCLPSALHPICYGILNSTFARAFSKTFMFQR